MKREMRTKVIRFRTVMALLHEMSGCGVLTADDIPVLENDALETVGLKTVTIFSDRYRIPRRKGTKRVGR